MKHKDNNSGFFLFWRGAIMQLKITTDYAIRIVYYLACRSEVITASELAYELKIPESYIPKITKKLKEANIITACEGIKGGYSLAKKTEDISLFDITFANINASVIPNSSYCFPIILSSLVYLISKYILNNKCASVNILFMCFGVSLCDVYLI